MIYIDYHIYQLKDQYNLLEQLVSYVVKIALQYDGSVLFQFNNAKHNDSNHHLPSKVIVIAFATLVDFNHFENDFRLASFVEKNNLNLKVDLVVNGNKSLSYLDSI